MERIEAVKNEIWRCIQAGIAGGIKPTRGEFGIYLRPGEGWTFQNSKQHMCCGLSYVVLAHPEIEPRSKITIPQVHARRVLEDFRLNSDETDAFMDGWDDARLASDNPCPEFRRMGRELWLEAVALWGSRDACARADHE